MNKAFKVLWNDVRRAYVVSNEAHASCGKRAKAAVLATVLALGSASVLAAPQTTIGDLDNVTITNHVTTGGNGWGGVYFWGDKNPQNVTVTNSTFSNNTVSMTNDGANGTVFALESKSHNDDHKIQFKNVTFENNQNLAAGTYDKQDGAWAAGGAVYVKGWDATFVDTVFKGNKVASEVEGKGVVAVGGAVFLDKQIDNAANPDPSKSTNSSATFVVTKNLEYIGNTVSNSNKDASTTLYGGRAVTSGGFLFMDRQSTATFDVAQNATLTIGVAGTGFSGKDGYDRLTDTIASSMTSTADANKQGGHNILNKKGDGTLLINTTLDDYNGLVDIQAGTMKVAADWAISNEVFVSGGVLDLTEAKYKFSSIQEKLGADSNIEAAVGAITVNGGSLKAMSKQLFSQVLDADGKGQAADSLKNADKYSFTSGTLIVADANYNLNYAKSLDSIVALNDVSKVFTGKIVDLKNEDLATGGTGDSVLTDVTFEGTANENGQVTIGGQGSSVNGNLGVQSVKVEAGEATKVVTVSVGANKKLTLTGDGQGGNLIDTKVDSTLNLDANATVQLGVVANADDVKQGGTLASDVTLGDSSKLNIVGGNYDLTKTVETHANAKVTVSDNATAKVAELKGAGTINVGNEKSAGTLVINKLSMTGGTIFLDPEWQKGVVASAEEINNASWATIGDIGTALQANIVVGQNSVAVLGSTDKQTALKAWADTGKVWGDTKDGITAMAYVDKQIVLDGGSITLDGSKTTAPATTSDSVTLADKSLLIVNAANFDKDTAVFKKGNATPATSSAVTVDAGANIYLSQATVGQAITIFDQNLSTNTGLTNTNFIFGNTLLTGTVDNGVVTVETDKDKVAKAVTGVQGGSAMIEALLGDRGYAAHLESLLGAGFDQAAFRQDTNVQTQATVASGVHRLALDAVNVGADAVYDAVAVAKDGVHGWASVTGNKTTSDGFSALGNDYGFKTELGGVAVGATYAQDAWKVGAALSVGQGTVHGKGEFDGTKNKADFYGINFYGSNDFGFMTLSGLAGWTRTTNDLSYAGKTADTDADAYYVGVRAEKTFVSDETVSLTPYVGLTYVHISTDATGFDYRNGSTSADLVEMPIGAKFNLSFASEGGWTFNPYLDMNVMPVLGDRDVTTSTNGVDVKSDVFNRGLLNAKLGVNAQFGQFSAGAKLGVSAGSADLSGVSASVTMGYQF